MTDFILPLSDPRAIDPENVGPKAANLAQLGQAGLPTPGGFALTAAAYRQQLRHLGIEDLLRQYNEADLPTSRKLSVQIRLALYEKPIAPEILEPLLAAWRAQRSETPLGVVRSSALIEDRKGANFAGQFESFLGLADETEFLTAVRACWAALWTSHARRYMDNHGLSPADTAMGVLIQPLMSARASGGGLSETAEGQMLISATWGLGSAIAQGEVVPDRIVLSKNGFLRTVAAGRKGHRDTCEHGVVRAAAGAAGPGERAVSDAGRGGHARPPAAEMRAARRRPGRDRMGDGRTRLQAAAVAPAACRGADRARRDLAAASRPQRPSRRHRLGLRPRRGGQLRMRTRRASRPATSWSPRWPGPSLSHILHRVSPASSPSSAARPRIWRRSRASAAFPWCWACSTPPAPFPTARNARSTASPASCGGCGERKTARLCHATDRAKARSSGCARWPMSSSTPTRARSSPSRN